MDDRLDRVSGCSRRPHLVPDANEASLTLGELLPTPRIEARIERPRGICHGRPVGVLHIDLDGHEPPIFDAFRIAQGANTYSPLRLG